MHAEQLIVVEGWRVPKRESLNLYRGDLVALALEQRAFGPRRLVVAFAVGRGRVVGLAHAERMDPPEAGLPFIVDYGLQHFTPRPTIAVAYCDEMVGEGPPPPDLAARYLLARSICAARDVLLVDWVSCDDDLFRFASIALDPNEPEDLERS